MQIQKVKEGYKLEKALFGKFEEIPKEWNFKSLIEIGDIVGGGTPDSTILDYWGGDILWATPSDITKLKSNYIENTERKITENGLNESSAKLLPIGTILITSRATIGECAIATKPIATNQGFQNIICNENNDNLFLFHAMKFHKNRLLRLAYGTTFLEISKKEMSKVSIPIPESKKEQQKIASILSNVDSLIIHIQKIIEQNQILERGLMQKLLLEGIDHTEFNEINFIFKKLIKIPKEWSFVTINELTKNSNDVKTGPFGSLLKKETFVSKGYKIYGQEHVIHDDFSLGNYYITKEHFEKLNDFEIKPYDVLISLIGTYGKVSVVPINIEPGIINPRLLRIRLDKNKVFPEYIKILLESYIIKIQISKYVHGLTMEIINTKILKKILFPIPQLNEQKQIMSILSNTKLKTKFYQNYKSNILTLKKGLMQKLLTGQLRVNL